MITDIYGNKWYKGNLHTHTKDSDGALPADEVKKLYKSLGYDFLAITDHWHINKRENYEGMPVFPGVEYDYMHGECYHIVAYGLDLEPELTRSSTPQQMIDEIKRCGGVVTLAHPAWSLQRPDKMAELVGIDCTEIYNSVSGYPYSARPYSGNLIDVAVTMGFRATLTAADDTHFYKDEVARGFVYVKADELTEEKILKAIKKGDCLATNGPFATCRVEDGYYIVSCPQGCKYMQFFSNNYYNPDTTATGDMVYEARFRLKPRDKFVRAEIVDHQGRVAYTQYTFLEDLNLQ